MDVNRDMTLVHRTFVVVLKDQSGSFLEVGRVFARRGVNITRVSYNKVVDPRTCFVEAEGTSDVLRRVQEDLEQEKVLPSQTQVGHVELVEFSLTNAPGSMIPVLELAQELGFNITYYDAKSTPEQDHSVRLGIYVERQRDFGDFLARAGSIYPVRRLEYDRNQHVIDTNLFYLEFAREITQRMGLTAEQEHSLLVNANRIVQCLENTNSDPFRPFDYLRRFSRGLDEYSGEAYAQSVRVTPIETELGAHITSIEPPAGSDTWVLECDEEILCIDSGYQAFAGELEQTLRQVADGWDGKRKVLVLTHADMDHTGGCGLFDSVLAVGEVLDSFRLEHLGKPNWRERTMNQRAYNRIGMILSRYETPWLDRFKCVGRRPEGSTEPIARCKDLDGMPSRLVVPPFDFEVWEGAGGHVRGETVLIDRRQHVCVSGDIFVNVHGETKPQSRFNALAPYLLTSVDSLPDLARKERKYLFGLLDPGQWWILGGHGAAFAYRRRSRSTDAERADAQEGVQVSHH